MLRALATLALATFAAACSSPSSAAPAREPSPPPPRVRVRTTPVTERPVAPALRATGLVVAKEQALLSFKVPGVVREVRVHAGDRARPGQLLARLDTQEIDAQVAQAEAAAGKARRDHRRAADLVADGAITVAASDDASTALRVAEEALRIARFNQRHATLVAAGEGRVARRLVEPNAVVAPGIPILQLNMQGAGYVIRAGFIDRDVVRLAPGATGTATLDAYPGLALPVRVTQIAEEPSPLSGVYDVELRLEAADAPRLVSGLVAKLELDSPSPPPVSLVPVASLVNGSGRRAAVYVVDADARARKQPVEIAFFTADHAAALTSGPPPGARVVTEGAAYLRPGAAVEELRP